jgi:hypothetical protein
MRTSIFVLGLLLFFNSATVLAQVPGPRPAKEIIDDTAEKTDGITGKKIQKNLLALNLQHSDAGEKNTHRKKNKRK